MASWGSFSWSNDHESWKSTATDGSVTGGSFASGEGAGAGSVHNLDNWLWESSSVANSTGDVDYSHTEYHLIAGSDYTSSESYTDS